MLNNSLNEKEVQQLEMLKNTNVSESNITINSLYNFVNSLCNILNDMKPRVDNNNTLTYLDRLMNVSNTLRDDIKVLLNNEQPQSEPTPTEEDLKQQNYSNVELEETQPQNESTPEETQPQSEPTPEETQPQSDDSTPTEEDLKQQNYPNAEFRLEHDGSVLNTNLYIPIQLPNREEYLIEMLKGNNFEADYSTLYRELSKFSNVQIELIEVDRIVPIKEFLESIFKSLVSNEIELEEVI